MDLIDKTFNVQGAESTIIPGTRCIRVYANHNSMHIGGFVCIFTNSSGEIVDMGMNSCLEINEVNMRTYEHTPVFKFPIKVGIFTMCNHFIHDITDQEESLWIHQFQHDMNVPLEFVFHLDIPRQISSFNLRLKLF
jgi:hypothetical protein